MSKLLSNSITNLLSFSLTFHQPKHFNYIGQKIIRSHFYFRFIEEKVICKRWLHKHQRIRDRKFYKSKKSQVENVSKLEKISTDKYVSETGPASLNRSTPLIVEMLLKKDKSGVNNRTLEEKTIETNHSLEEMKSSIEKIKWDIDALHHRQKMVMRTSDKLILSNFDKRSDNGKDNCLETQKQMHTVKGSPDPTFPITGIPCSGCGALLHCYDTAISGYMPSEKLKSLTRDELRSSTCQRCFLIQHHNMCLNVNVRKDELPQIFSRIKEEKALVLVVIDLFDMRNSIIKDLSRYIGRNRPLYIIGNKVDMIPKDQIGYLQRIKNCLVDECYESGLLKSEKDCKHVCLVSAKTGYGIEELVTKLMMDWQLKGNIFVVGNTNSGKSTLFNALLQSDFCKANVRDVISRATVSVWPGTTLSLLKFPVVNPTPWRLFKRKQRLLKNREAHVEEERLRKQRVKMEGRSKNATLIGYVNTTDFRKDDDIKKEIEQADSPYGYDFTSYELQKDGLIDTKYGKQHIIEDSEQSTLKENMFQMSKWFFDTPGVINKNQIINGLTQQELFKVLPKGLIKPDCFVLAPRQVMFISGLGRLDYVQGDKSIVVTVHTSDIPVHILNGDEADDFYRLNIGTETLGLPLGDDDHLNAVPSLIGREYQMTGLDMLTASADIQLSSLGWLSFCIPEDMEVSVRAYVPGGHGCYIRRPALLPHASKFRGPRIRGTPRYKHLKPVP